MNENKPITAFKVRADVYQRVVNTLSQLPYNQVASLLSQVEQHSEVIYETEKPSRTREVPKIRPKSEVEQDSCEES